MERIFFEETSGPALGAATALALKQKQVARLEAKIAFLERKQEDLNRKVDEYIQGLRALILSLEQSMKPPGGGAPGEGSQKQVLSPRGTP